MQTITSYSNLELLQALEAAERDPLSADLLQLWEKLEQTIKECTRLDRFEKLLLAAEAISQIFKIHVLRANEILDTLEVKDNSQGPILPDDFLDDLMRKSMTIDISDLMEELFSKDQSSELKTLPDKSGASSRKAQKDAKGLIETLPERENVSQWKRAIALWFQQHPDSQSVSLVELWQGLGMPMIEVWLGLLLGGEYQLQQLGEFYDPKGIHIAKH